MGGCIFKTSFTVTSSKDAKKGVQPFLFSVTDAEAALIGAGCGDYLLYRDCVTEKDTLSVRMSGYTRHYRISNHHGLYHLDGQPYAYLDSIILFHQRRKLNGVKLKKQAFLSAKAVRNFAHQIANTNGNQNTWANQNGQTQHTALSSAVDNTLCPLSSTSAVDISTVSPTDKVKECPSSSLLEVHISQKQGVSESTGTGSFLDNTASSKDPTVCLYSVDEVTDEACIPKETIPPGEASYSSKLHVPTKDPPPLVTSPRSTFVSMYATQEPPVLQRSKSYSVTRGTKKCTTHSRRSIRNTRHVTTTLNPDILSERL